MAKTLASNPYAIKSTEVEKRLRRIERNLEPETKPDRDRAELLQDIQFLFDHDIIDKQDADSLAISADIKYQIDKDKLKPKIKEPESLIHYTERVGSFLGFVVFLVIMLALYFDH